jgi:hypothetical protein
LPASSSLSVIFAWPSILETGSIVIVLPIFKLQI